MTWKIDSNYWIHRTSSYNQPVLLRFNNLTIINNYTYKIIENSNQPPSMKIYAHRINLVRHKNGLNIADIFQLGVHDNEQHCHVHVTEVAPKIAIITGSFAVWAHIDTDNEIRIGQRLIHLGHSILDAQNTPWFQINHEWQLAKLKLFDSPSTAVIFAVRQTPEGWYPEYYHKYAIQEHSRQIAALVISPYNESKLWIGYRYVRKFSGKNPDLNEPSQIYTYLAKRLARRHKTTFHNFFERVAFGTL